MRVKYDTQAIIESYNSGKNSTEIAAECGLHRTAIPRILRRNGITVRTYSESNRHYVTNETFFDIIDSEEKAYVLGLMYADGNLCRNQLELCLQEEDKEILETISLLIFPKGRALGYRPPKDRVINGKIYQCQAQYRLSIVNEHIKKAVTKLGLFPKKSLILTYPNWLNMDLHRHFIRGYFDGDGTISMNSNTGDKILKILGTMDFCTDMLKVIRENIQIKGSARKRVGTRVHHVCITGNIQINRFLEWMYLDHKITMARKYSKYKALFP